MCFLFSAGALDHNYRRPEYLDDRTGCQQTRAKSHRQPKPNTATKPPRKEPKPNNYQRPEKSSSISNNIDLNDKKKAMGSVE